MVNTKRIESYSIADFVKQIQEGILDGFRLNLEDNEKYPLQIGVGFYCTMDKCKDGEAVVPVVLPAVNLYEHSTALEKDFVSNAPQPHKPGRKPKV